MHVSKVTDKDVEVFQLFPFVGAEPAHYHTICRKINAQYDRKALSASPERYLLEAWDGGLEKQRFSIQYSDLNFECFATPSSVKKLFVFLSAGGGQVKMGDRPEFQRASWHPWLQGVCINIADPTFSAFPGKLTTGWYIGSKKQDAIPPLADIIRKILSKYAIDASNVYVVGSSAGGTSALKLARVLSGITVVVENPPVYPHERGSSKRYLEVGIDLSSEEYHERNNLRHVNSHCQSRYFIFQNADDKRPMKNLADLLCGNGLPKMQLGLNSCGNLNIYHSVISNQSPHHAFMKVNDFRLFIKAIESVSSKEYLSLLLDSIFEGIRLRALQSDKIKNLKGWSTFLKNISMPSLLLPLPTDHHELVVPIKNVDAIGYKAVLNHSGKKMSFSVELPCSVYENNKNMVDELMSKTRLQLAKSTSGYVLEIKHVAIDKAAHKFKSFVRATLPIVQGEHS